jgi:predicted HTH transcriptional regulator
VGILGVYNISMQTFRISDTDILKRLESSEDSYLEKKSLNDMEDVVKTCVAFANTCPVEGPPGILCFGVREDGTIEDGLQNLESTTQKIRDKLSQVYPPIEFRTRIITRDGKGFLAVIVPGSSNGPHFSGPAYVREGSSTVVANEELFSMIIDKRERKVREILKWKDKRILMRRYVLNPAPNQQRNPWAYSDARVVDCAAEWLQLEIGGAIFPFPLDDVRLLGHSPQPPNLLQIEVPQ